jgi:hypothetical protein
MSSKFFKRIAAPGLLGLALLAVVLLATIGGGSNASANQGIRGLDRALAANQAHSASLLSIDGVVGTGVGAGNNGTAIVFVFTESAGVRGIPSSVGGVTVIPAVTGEISALHHRIGHSGGPGNGGDDPTPTPTPAPGPVDTRAPIGSSTGTERLITDGNGNFFCTVGSLGLRVSDGTNVYALSNAHVYALEGSTPVGTVSAGDDILHPGRVDMTEQSCGSGQEIDDAKIGDLHVWSDVVPGGTNTIDAALAVLSSDGVGVSTPPDGYGTPSSDTLAVNELFFRQKVEKYGRTTGLTEGKVWAIDVNVNIGYDTGIALFTGQIAIRGGGFSNPGDSGSIVVTKDGNRPIGLLFAGGGRYTFLNPIDDVLAELSGMTGLGQLQIDVQ